MGIKFLFLSLLVAVLFISGCAQTGSIINKSTQDDEPNFIATPIDENETTEANMKENETGNIEYSEHEEADMDDTEDRAVDPCEDITCSDSVTICDDGFKARCKNQCSEGACPICRPDCAGHVVSEPEDCELSCGTCEDDNIEACRCDLIVPCDGNGACEEGEYPGSEDCPDCIDGQECTEDLFNFTSNSCYYEIKVPCCGNGACESSQHENSTTCPEDCNASQEAQEPGQVTIAFIEQYDEWVEIVNPQSAEADLSNWTLFDAAGHVYTFPSFSIPASTSVIVHTGHGPDNATDLFWNRGSPVWNNNGDNATLRNAAGDAVSNYSY
jgi:hypothetical protein